MIEKSYSPREVQKLYSISYEKARQIIIAINGDDQGMKPKNKGRGKRPYRLRRVAESLLKERIGDFING